MKSSSVKLWVALLLPIVVLGLWTLRLRNQGRSGVDVELPVEGFDPLDHISGHYVTYRLAMGRHDPCRPTSGPLVDREAVQCLCLDESPSHQPSWGGACEQKPSSCDLFLKGTCPWSGFTAGVERFYIPETDSAWLKVVPPKSSIIITLNGSGGGLVKAFRPEGQDYKVWIERKKAEQKPSP
ncbi:MAG TPA: GDYXXLXY domain-containing protein [Oligoflexus sp.]|uniref:GDYXXLXY domain-containing protein n=1 Tax=Oligoflexus sp. TaxID=1971216 RepID=UPI002D6CB610|nr:GDYXXLXY domain-containing protein [Oligoflexus sp.]HYX38825.1 GDYXXLXY domain-containing protein [Oligoflexus sp.]